MRFKGLDLNLVAALNVLMEERSVSRAADRLGLSQPAMSAALSRLRDCFHDDLLVQHGRRMFSTPYADQLAPRLADFLRSAEALAAISSVFDPATSDRRFRIIASDYVVLAILAPLAARLAREATTIKLEFVLPDQHAPTELQSGKADLYVTPSDYVLPDQASEVLYEERHVVAGCRSNPLFYAPVTEDRMFACGQVVVQLGSMRQRTFADTHLDQLGKPRNVEVIAGSFASVPWLLMGTERIAVMHERLARDMARRLPIRFAPLPFAFPTMEQAMQFHPSRAADEGLIWLRAQIRAQVAQSDGIQKADRKRSRQSI